MIVNLSKAVNLIKTTVDNNSNPYFFVVGAGISVPEIPLSNEIVEICKQKVKDRDESDYEQCVRDTANNKNNPMKYYSSWISLAYPNRIDRSNFFKKLISNAKISSANLMLAQILSSKKIAKTVFTTNFDDKIKAALDLIGEKDIFVSENAMDNLVVSTTNDNIQIVHVHGTYNFYDCANIESEIAHVASQSGTISSSTVLSNFLSLHAPIIVGYSGWENDVIMSCIRERLQYPTPLSYVWVCYTQSDYDLLPDDIKNNDNILFVLPETIKQGCEGDDSNHFMYDIENKEQLMTIDARRFFSELISKFCIETPSLFVNPFSYYSKQINDVLPEHEDVLHLKHWAQRMQYFGSNEKHFDKLVTRMEQASIQSDFNEASKCLKEFSNEQLTENDLKFISNSLIRDLIKKETSNCVFDEVLTFHKNILDFAEQTGELSKKDEKELLRKALFVQTDIEDKAQYLSLVDRVIKISESNEEFISIHMAALGVKSSYVDDDKEEKQLLTSLLSKAPKQFENEYIKQLKGVAYLELSELETADRAEELYDKAAKLLKELNNPLLDEKLLLTKSNLLRKNIDRDTKNKWIEELIEFINNNLNIKKELVLSIGACMASVSKEPHVKIQEILNCLIGIIEKYSIDIVNPNQILNYCLICEFVSDVTDSNSIKMKCCDLVFASKNKVQSGDELYINILQNVMIDYCSLPIAVLPDEHKINRLKELKITTKADERYYRICKIAYDIGDKEKYTKELLDVVNYIENYNKMMDGVRFYCDKNFKEAEQIFESLINCGVEYIENSSIINLAFMVRRNEATIKREDFLDIINKVTQSSALKNMNLILYFQEENDTDNSIYITALEELKNMSSSLIEEMTACWGDVDLVGEAEHNLAKDILSEIGIEL